MVKEVLEERARVDLCISVTAGILPTLGELHGPRISLAVLRSTERVRLLGESSPAARTEW